MSEALKQKYAHITLEHLETLDEGQLSDLEHQVTQERKMLEIQLEDLQAAGGVSRDMANSYTEYLPKEMALESFTGQLTCTNYDMSVESLSTALKIVVAVGVIAGLGTLVWLFTRSSNRERKEVNEKGVDSLERLRSSVKRAEKEFGSSSLFKDGVDASGEPTPEELAEMERKHEEIQKRYNDRLAESKKKEETEALMQAAQGGLDAYTWSRLLNMMKNKTDMKAGYAVHSIYAKAEFTINADFKELLIPSIDAAVKFSKSGREDDLKALHNLMERRPVDRVMKTYNVIGEVITQIMAGGGARAQAKFDDAEGAMRVFMQWCESPPKIEDWLMASVRSHLIKDDYRVEAPDYTRVLKDIDKLLEVGKELPAQEKRLKEIESLPKEVSEALNTYIEATKQNLKAVDYLAALINLEVVTFNRMLKFANQQLAGSVQTTIDSLDLLIADPDVSQKMKAVAMKTVREIKASMTK